MRKIGAVYGTDLKHMFKSIPVMIVIVGLIILPSLYAWFNIKANWDPYGGTSGIKVGIVNEDQGENLLGQTINIGEEVVKELRTNNKLGWQFVNRQEAEYNTKSGKYYAYILIPNHFSKDLGTILGTEQVRPELIYVINEKSNAIAPKITSTGANTLKITISENIISTINEVVFNVFNNLGVSIEQNLPKIRKATEIIRSLDEHSNVIGEDLAKYHQGLISAEEIFTRTKEQLPNIQTILQKVTEITADSQDMINSSEEVLNQVADEIEITLQSIASNCEEIRRWSEGTIEQFKDANAVTEGLNYLTSKLDFINTQVQSLQGFLSKLPGNIGEGGLSSKLGVLSEKITGLSTEANNASSTVAQGKEVALDVLDSLKERTASLEDLSQQGLTIFSEETRPQIKGILTNTVEVAKGIQTLSETVKGELPTVSQVVGVGLEGVRKGEDLISAVQEKFPTLQKEIHELASKLNFFMNDQSLDTLLSLLKNNPKLVANYIAAPVNLKEEALYPIPNYGSAMAPFYSVLAIWVGVVILTALLSTETHVKEVSVVEEYIGKGFTFLTLSVIQSLIIALGDLCILKVYMVNPFLFILLAMGIGVVFTSIIYTLVALFGNLGKGIVIILLVLQIASSGGTFPVEVIPPFFQKISPYLPFTYAIGAVREVQGGIFGPNLSRDLMFLGFFLLLFVMMGILFKKTIVKWVKAFNEDFRRSGLGE